MVRRCFGNRKQFSEVSTICIHCRDRVLCEWFVSLKKRKSVLEVVRRG